MSNRFLKLCADHLPGKIFNSAVNETGQLAIESRAKEITSLSIYDLKNGELVSHTEASISPWHSLAAFDDVSLVLRYFENKQNPDQVSFIRYDHKTNGLMNEVNVESIEWPTTEVPSLFIPESEGFRMVAQFLDQPIVLGCEYLEHEDVIIVSYYLPFGKCFERKFLVLKNGEEVVSEAQDKSLNGFAPGSFFTFQKRLIFISENTELNIYEI